MSRNFLSSLIALVCLLFMSQRTSAQAFQATCNPNYIFANTGCIQCFNPNGNTGGAGVVAFPPSATTYTWIIQTPTSCSTPATHTCQGTDCSSITLSYACCGIYTINSVAINGTLSPPQPVAQSVIYQTVVCSSNASVAVAQPTICIGGGGTALTASGAQTYTWFGPGGGLGNANPIVVTPTANTCYTVIGTTTEGCTVTATGCVAVQSASLSVSPASQTMCLGSQVCFTATGGAINNSSVTPGTGTTGIQWFDPNGNPFSTAFTTCTTAIGGNYTSILTHTGAAGTCTVQAIAAVAIGTNINVSINIAPSTSVCPGNNVTLTAVAIATTASQFTWTSSDGMVPLNGKSIVVNPTVNTVYTVTVDYFGCPGTATIAVGMLTLTPNITASSPSICPGTDFTLTATGGTTYTWYYVDPNAPFSGTVIGTPNTTSNSIAHSPSLGLPGTYSVMAFGGGCSGAAFFTVQEFSLYPTLAASSPSICPGTNFTLTAGNVGGTPNYTFMAGYPASGNPNPNIITTGTANPIVHNPGTNLLPQTYTVYVDSSGCTGEAQVTVNLMVLNPTLSLLGNTTGSVCPGTEFTLSSTGGAGTTYTFYTTPNPGVAIGTPTNTQNFAPHQPGSLPRNYWVKVDSVGCKGIDTIRVGILNLSPKVSLLVTNQNGTVFTAANPSVCPNTTFTLNVMGVGTGSMTSFTITAPIGGTTVPFQTASSATHAISASNFNATYTVAADSAGCIGTNTLQVRRLTLNTQVTATPSLVCAGMPVTVCATGGSTTIFNYFYVVGTTSTQLAANTASSCTVHSNPGPTTQIVYVAFADSAGCTGFGNALVNIAPGLVLNATSSTPTVCSGSAVTLSVTGPANASYSWAAVVGTLSTPLTGMLPYATASAGVTDNPTVTTTYVVTGLDPAGCTGTAAITVSINPTASLTLVVGPQNPTICPGQSATLSVSGTNSYTWSPAGSLSPSAFVPTVIASPSVTTIYTVVGTNNAGCYGSGTVTLTVNQFPVLTFAPTAYSVCAGFTSTITAFGAQSYTWTGSTFTNAIAQQSIAVGNGCFTVTGSNGGTCIKSASICIGVAPPLNIQVSASSMTTCIVSNNPKFSKPVKLSASGASSYVWLPYNPLVMTYSIGATTTVRPPASTCYTVIGATSICSNQQTICITVIPQFTMNVVPPLPAMCIGDSLNLKIVNISTLAVGPVSAFTYSWSEAQNAPPISISPSNLSPTVMVFPQNTTTYTVEVADSRKCMSVPRLVTVTVFPMPETAVAIPTINNVPTNTVCFVGDNPGPPDVVLNLLAENKNTNLQFGVVPTYTWVSPYPKEYNSILTPPNNPGITVSAPLRLPSLVTYTVFSGYNGIPGCRVMDTVTIRVIDCRPVRGVKFTTAEPNDTVCARDCITFINLTDTMAGGPQKVEWTFPGGNPPKSNEPNPTVCYNLPSERGYNVILKVSNPYPMQNGEGSSAISGFLQYVKVVDVPNITIVPPGQLRSDTVIRFGTEVKLTASGGKSYNWSPNYNISSNTSASVTVKPFRTTQYVLTGYNSKNCASRDTINVIVIEDCGDMYVPNAFSPNADGHNDVLYVQGICLQTMSFMIFNRWGEKVFETTDQKQGWDGSYKGEQLNTGVFVYRLEGKTYDGKAYSSKGNITLVR
jgi:gliding motility-associated-like protein